MTGQKNITKTFWAEAMTGGLVLGVLLFAWNLIGYWLNMPMANPRFASLVQFLILTGVIVYFSRRTRDFRGPALGFPYGTAFGFVMAMMLFTGIVYGIGTFFLQIVIAPEYYNELIEVSLLNSDLDEEMVEEVLAVRDSMMSIIRKNPIFYVLSGMFYMALTGGLIGLISSAFLKRPADPFASQNDEDEYVPGNIE